MLGVQGREEVANAEARGAVERVANSTRVGQWLTWCGVSIMALSAFGGVFPYFSNGLGLPLDGASDGVMTAWRTILHLLPGVLGIAAGAAMVVWGRRRSAGITVDPTQARFVGRFALVVGAWFAIGPYLYGIIAPSQAHGTGGMTGAMQGSNWLIDTIMPMFGNMTTLPTTANCALTMGVCHWAVGGVIVFAGLVATGAGLGVGPLAGLSRVGLAEEL